MCDLDGDGVLTSSDLFPFYSQQCVKMLEVGGEVVKFEDVLCQFADLLRPARPGSIRIEDFLNPERVKLTGCFFNALFDLGKFHRFEAREVRMVKQGENYDASHSQWNCYAVSWLLGMPYAPVFFVRLWHPLLFTFLLTLHTHLTTTTRALAFRWRSTGD